MTRTLLPAAKRLAISLCVLSTGAILSAGLATTASAQVPCPQANTAGPPVVHNQHIFCGEIRRGRAKGFHSRPGGVNPNSVNNTGVPYAPDTVPDGIYFLYGFNIVQGGQTRVKAISTMFPDACSRQNVLDAIRNAVGARRNQGRFTGMSGAACQAGNPLAPFEIVGFLDNQGEVITAWPNYDDGDE